MAENTGAQLLVKAFTLLSDDSGEAVARAKKNWRSVDQWRNSQAWPTAIASGYPSSISVAHLATGVAETLYLLHKMAWCSWGIGGLRGCEVEGKNDLQYILGLWSRTISEGQVLEMFVLSRQAALLKKASDSNPQIKRALVGQRSVGQVSATVSTEGMPITLSALSHVVVNRVTFAHVVAATSQAVPHATAMAIMGTPHAVSIVVSKGAAKVTLLVTKEVTRVGLAPYLGSMLAQELVANHFAYQLGVAMQQHAGPFLTKIAEQAAAKITKKAASRFVVGFIPFVGALAAAEINVWILQGIADSADSYYRLKAEAAAS